MTVIEGIQTTIPLHLRILQDPDFVAGRLSTGFMDRYQPHGAPAGVTRPPPWLRPHGRPSAPGRLAGLDV